MGIPTKSPGGGEHSWEALQGFTCFSQDQFFISVNLCLVGPTDPTMLLLTHKTLVRGKMANTWRTQLVSSLLKRNSFVAKWRVHSLCLASCCHGLEMSSLQAALLCAQTPLGGGLGGWTWPLRITRLPANAPGRFVKPHLTPLLEADNYLGSSFFTKELLTYSFCSELEHWRPY